MFAIFATTVFVALALGAAWSDLRTRRISNRFVLAILALGLLRQAATLEPSALALGAAGVAVGLAILLPAFAARWIGGADVKLLAAFGAWLGPWSVLLGGLVGIALGGVLALGMAVAGGAGREALRNVGAAALTLTAPIAPRRRRALVVPMAVPFAVGCTFILLGGLS